MQKMTIFNLIFLLILSIFSTTNIWAFEALPFLQIDQQFYLRLAQCQAKCGQTFPIKKLSKDEADVELLEEKPTNDNADSLQTLCYKGCLDSDSAPSSTISFHHNNPKLGAFAQGQHFFHQSSSALITTNSNSPTKSVQIRPLCAQRMANGMLGNSASEKFETILTVDMEGIETGEEEWNCCKFVISWRRKATMGIDAGEGEMAKNVEPKWIVASIEPSRTFRVTGLRAGGLLYQFKVQPISVNGPLGQPAFSDWIDFGELAGDNSQQGPIMEGNVALSFFSQFNAEHGVAAWMRWNRKEEAKIEKNINWPKPVLNYRLRRSEGHHLTTTTNSPKDVQSNEGILDISKNLPIPVIFPACQLQIEWANKSSRTIEQLELDGSDGFLLPHLAYNTQYSVLISALSDPSIKRPLLEATFLSMHCAQVFGAGSLECEPDPPSQIFIIQFPMNGSALVNWERPEAIGNILLYELGIEPIKDTNGQCQVRPSARIVSAQSNSALISLPQTTICEFEIRLTLYDLLGREAAAFVRFQFKPAGISPAPIAFTSSALGQLFHQLDPSTAMALLVVLILVPTMAILTLICTFWRQAGSRQQKIAAKQMKEGRQNGKRKNGKHGRELDEKMRTKAVLNNGSGSSKSTCNSPQSSLASACGTETTTTVIMAKGMDENEMEGENGMRKMTAKRNWRQWRMARHQREAGMPNKMITVALGEV